MPSHISFFYFIEVELICNVVLISSVQESDSVIHIYSFFVCVLFHCDLSQDTEYIEYTVRTFLFIRSIYNGLHLLSNLPIPLSPDP